MIKTIIIFFTLLMSVGISHAQTTQEWRDSVSYLSRLIEQNPKSLELRMRKAEANIMLEQWQYALDEYTNILELYPSHLGALYFRGYVNDKLHRFSFARADYEAVLHFAPDHEGALHGLIKVNIEDNRLHEAYDESNHLVELYPDHSRSYSIRSQVEETAGYLELAIEDISRSIELEKALLSESYRLSLNDNLTQYVLSRIELNKKLGKKYNLKQVEADKQLLITRGIPSKLLTP